MIVRIACLLVATAIFCGFAYTNSNVYFTKDYENIAKFVEAIPLSNDKDARVRHDLSALFSAYPSHCIGVEFDKNNHIYVIMFNGIRFMYDDCKIKSFEEKLDNPDLQDMMEQTYISGRVKENPSENFDPGRFRVIGFFKAIYGETKDNVLHNSRKMPFIRDEVTFNSVAGASDALHRVSEKLSILIKEKPELTKYVLPIGGTLNWRLIEGTQRLSPHSFATAIDLNPAQGPYWRWGTRSDIRNVTKEYPLDIIRIFEEQGFIWGGKWHHYDLMHFEYRPELLFTQ
jgi:hypothetical protein